MITTNKKDIADIQDVELLVNTFYDKVKNNSILAYVFNDVAKVNWENHCHVCIRFGQVCYWASIVLMAIRC